MLSVLSYSAMEAQLTKAEAIRLAKGVKSLARIFGISSSAVSQWGAALPSARIWQLRCLRPEWFMVSPESLESESNGDSAIPTSEATTC